ncbi:MAG: hypothetical protein ACREMI_12550 [Gemmatimonadales bacterium]
MAVEVMLPDSARAEVTDTYLPRGRALNGFGDSVAAQLYWSSLDTAIIAVLDSATGVSLAKAVGTGRLQARVDALRSNPQNVAVLTKLDSLVVNGPTRDTVTLLPDTAGNVDSLSVALQVQAFASPVVPAGRPVVYAATTFPASGPVVTLVPTGSVLTSATGVANVRLRLLAGAIPDSVVVTATMQRPDGTAIPGSPVTFVVEFGP